MNRKPTVNRKLVIAAVATAALAISGTTLAFAGDDTSSDALAAALRADADDRADDRDDDRDDQDGSRDDSDDRWELRDAEVTLQKAVEAALKAVPGTAESAEPTDDGDRPAWEIDILGEDGRWHEITVDAGNGGILDRDDVQDDRDDDRDDRDDDRDDRDDDRDDDR
ncbi:DNA primase [Streptomyces carminius]|uniref:DNA primase n=1 Tax=Streptomyces carminius TaxID=2665496 RepID=A0A2M8LVU4_9ACTN|nr:PepSY domain-containing protein [Streptomyces carminius]PJE96029.1 DNA primase [Streptomyces carminius]